MSKKMDAEKGVIGVITEKKNTESLYTIKELAENAPTVFGGVASECVITALDITNKNEFTIDEAKKLIDDFLKRTVK